MNTHFPLKSLAALLTGALVITGCQQKLEPDPLPPMPRIISFTGSAGEVPIGGTVTLQWTTENATEVKIEELSLGAISGAEALEGSVEVAVTSRALFVLTAKNARGATDSAVVSVRVQGQPSDLLFTSSVTSVESGQPVTLAWSAPGATNVSLSAAPGGAIDLGGQTQSGAVVVRPTATTRYTLNAGGTTSTLEVAVSGRIVSFSATPTAASAGGTVSLSWATANADRVQLLAPGREPLVDTTDTTTMASGGFEDTLPATVEPGQFFSYELRVTTGAVTLKRTLVVTIAGNPVVVRFTAPEIAKHGPGEQLTLSWQTAEADSVSLLAEGVEIYRSPTRAIALDGSLTLVTPSVDTTYVIRASSSRGGSTDVTRVVDVVRNPTVSVTSAPSSVVGGDEVTLNWAGTDIRGVRIVSSTDGLVVQRKGQLDTGSALVRVNADATFTVTVDNGSGDEASDTASVTVTAPITLSVAQSGSLRFGQNVSVTASQPGELIGLPHTTVSTHPSAFVDIQNSGTRLPLTNAGTFGPAARLVSPFRMAMFGREVGQDIMVTRNGQLVFGDYANNVNSQKENLPTTKLEPMSVVPYWESISLSAVYWELRSVGSVSTLIVQWNWSSVAVQAKLHSTGQIDFEYGLIPVTPLAKVGVQGLTRDQGVSLPSWPATIPPGGVGFTFFGPMPQPVQIPAYNVGAVRGTVQLAPGRLVRAAGILSGTMVNPDELALTEVMPRSSVGVQGQWLELTNWRSSPIDLSGWSLTLADGGVLAPLNATIPARSTLVLGNSTDPALNGDAGVQVALSGFDLTNERSVSLSRDGVMQTVSLTQADGGFLDAGVARTYDPGPFRYPTGNATPAGPLTCVSAQTYGGQRGSPGSDRGCGFPYAKSTIPGGFFDIAGPSTGLSFVDESDGLASLSLTAAPVPFFGQAQTSMVVSINGYLSFDEASVLPTQYFAQTEPVSANTNSVLAVFAADLQLNKTSFQDSNVYVKRVGQGEDPHAAAPHWIVQWHHVSTHFGASLLRDDLSFQAKLFDDGVIEYHYAQLRSGTGNQYGSGLSATTWLEAPGGLSALAHNVRATAPGLTPNSAIRFTPRGTP